MFVRCDIGRLNTTNRTINRIGVQIGSRELFLARLRYSDLLSFTFCSRKVDNYVKSRWALPIGMICDFNDEGVETEIIGILDTRIKTTLPVTPELGACTNIVLPACSSNTYESEIGGNRSPPD